MNILLSGAHAKKFVLSAHLIIGAWLLHTPHLHAQNAPTNAALECAFGQPDLADQLRSPSAIAAQAVGLKDAAKTAEPAREQRVGLAQEAIESALLAQSVGKNGDAYWKLLKNDLADTRWRLSKRGEKGDLRAQWAFTELGSFESKNPWDAKSCRALDLLSAQNARVKTEVHNAPNTIAQASILYRLALCASESAPEHALAPMQKAADAGHPAAQETIGRLCATQGEAARACAVKYLCLAADAGRVSAAGVAAFLITETRPTVAMAVKAAALYEKSVNAGELASANNLGEVYELGWIGKVDLAKAERFYRVAAQADVAQAQLNLARLLHQRDPTQANMWLDKAALSLPKEAAQLRARLFKDE